MTEHNKATSTSLRRALLNSSHETIHASADEAVAVGFVMVNLAERFRSPSRGGEEITEHDQPHVTKHVVEKIGQMPRRTKPGEHGFDALAIVVVDCRTIASRFVS